MPAARTRGDSLGIFASMTDAGALWLGGNRSGVGVQTLVPIVSTPIPPLTYAEISGMWGQVTATVSAKTANTIAVNGVDELEGAEVAIGENECVLVEAKDDPDRWIRVFRDSDYSGADFDAGGQDDLSLVMGYGGIGMVDVDTSVSVQNHYCGVVFTNQEADAKDITALKFWLQTQGTQRVSDVAQMGATGAAVITTSTADGFSDWPEKGWVCVTTNAGVLREIAYYASRTATTLTIASFYRARLGTSMDTGAATDLIDAIPGIRIGIEVPSAGVNSFQEIASATTAPTGVTWSTAITSATGVTHTTLQSRENVMIWVHRELPANVQGYPGHLNSFKTQFVCDGGTYNNLVAGKFRVGQPGLALWRIWTSTGGTDPDLTTTPTLTTSTLPSIFALTPPGAGTTEYRVVTRKQDKYGIETKNTYSHRFVIDSGGVDVASGLSNPRNITVDDIGSGNIRIIAYYDPLADDDPADTWLVYISFGGVTPDPDVDTPVITETMGEAIIGTGVIQLHYTGGGLSYGTELQLIVRVQRSGDSVESENTDVYSLDIESAAPALLSGTLQTTRSSHFGLATDILETDTHSASPLVKTIAAVGATWLDIVGTIPFRAVVHDNGDRALYIPQTLDLVNAAVGGAGTNGVEVIDANTVYLVANSVRQVKIDLAAGTITAAEFQYNGVIPDNPTPEAVSLVNSVTSGSGIKVFTYLSVFNPVRNRWEPFIYLDDSGTCVFGYPVIKLEA